MIAETLVVSGPRPIMQVMLMVMMGVRESVSFVSHVRLHLKFIAWTYWIRTWVVWLVVHQVSTGGLLANLVLLNRKVSG